MTAVAASPLATYTLRIADDAFVLSHRLAQWSSRAPTLEEDVALTNIALDLLGQARALYTYAGTLDGTERSDDDYVFLRDERDFVNCQLVELENGDFATTIARQLLFSTFQRDLWNQLRRSTDEQLAAVASKAVKETEYHADHAVQWTLRLGDGTDESHARMQSALDSVWPFCHELFETDAVSDELAAAGLAVDPAALRPGWLDGVTAVVGDATLDVPSSTWTPGGGRRGLHTESFGYMVAEMQHLHRSHPGARW